MAYTPLRRSSNAKKASLIKWGWSGASQSGTSCWRVPHKIGAIIFSDVGFEPPYHLTVVCRGVKLRVELTEREHQNLRLARRRAQRIMLWLERGSPPCR